MSIEELKTTLLNLIEKSDNRHLLEAVFNLFLVSDSPGGEKIWQSLTEKQHAAILRSFEHSQTEKFLLDNNTVMNRINETL